MARFTISVSFQSIISSYKWRKIWYNSMYIKFPSPFRVSFLLMLWDYQIIKILDNKISVSFQSIISSYFNFLNFLFNFCNTFPSPFRVSFLLIFKSTTQNNKLKKISVSFQSIISSYNSELSKLNYSYYNFRLLSEYHFFLSGLSPSLVQLPRISVSFQSIISSYPLSINPLFYHILFYYFRENFRNLYISLP